MLKLSYSKFLKIKKHLKQFFYKIKALILNIVTFLIKRRLIISSNKINKLKDKNSTSIPEKGFMYIALGINFYKECISSVRILKSQTNLPIYLFTDIQNITESERALFYSIKQVKKMHLRSKVDYISFSPFKNTIYLDTDIIVVKNIDDLFLLLDRYDFIATLDTARKRKNIAKRIDEYDKIPYVYGEINGGLLGFNEFAKNNIINKWSNIFYKYMHLTDGWDQPSLRILLWKYKASLFILPPEYNVRSKDLLKKVKSSKHLLGDDHMKPRIYHMHIFKEIYEKDKNYDFISEDEIIRIAKENAYKINY